MNPLHRSVVGTVVRVIREEGLGVHPNVDHQPDGPELAEAETSRAATPANLDGSQHLGAALREAVAVRRDDPAKTAVLELEERVPANRGADKIRRGHEAWRTTACSFGHRAGPVARRCGSVG